jgi:valyl-tRNA synthetase
MPFTVPEKPSLEGLEEKWSERWEDAGTYRFDRRKTRPEIYAIDTPPPTVSGSLHVGHVFSYTHTDCVARYRRMQGLEVWYPMGWDDNGLPTERRVQNYYGVRCDPSLPYDPDFEPPATPPREPIAISRPNFVERCLRLTVEDERAFEALWRRLGLSVDWSHTYTTIGREAQRTSQRGFLRLLARGEAYAAEAPTLWDVDFQTAVAQAEMEDREQSGAYYRLVFHRPGGEALRIDTTRPELLPACVAVVAHPDDPRYQALFGTTVRTPLFGADVPVLAHELAEPDKGTGIAMICTFGDVTDVLWWRELGLPVRAIVGRNGRLLPAPPPDLPAEGQAVYAELAGKTVRAAQRRIAELLADSGELDGEPRPIVHPVKFYERGERPLEIVTSRQWFIRTLDHREELLQRGKELRWHPAYMQTRYESWVEGLNSDWLISRQRFFGVPFPVWYRLDAEGSPDHEHPLLAAEDRLPVDPSSDVPDGYEPEHRGQPGGFIGDPDVMDTWATSSLTPEIVCQWQEDPDLFARTYPMDLRPQAHDIIRTWLFSSVVRAHLEFGGLPWSDAAISGWVLDPDRKKMSKSKGNVVTPMGLLEEYGSDAVRYWAARGRPGADTAFDDGQMKIGRRLAIKILNASKFALGVAGEGGEVADGAAITAPLDQALLAGLADVAADATAAFEAYDYSRALEQTERFFWAFCDDYVELVKQRAYGTAGEPGARSARATLLRALDTLLRLFAPHLPFVTEEVWSWWQHGSVHRAAWPDPSALRRQAGDGDRAVFVIAGEVLGAVRKHKTERQRSLRVEAERVLVRDTALRLALLRPALDDVREAARARALDVVEGEPPTVEVELAEPDAA